jgi:hypothetical protein
MPNDRTTGVSDAANTTSGVESDAAGLDETPAVDDAPAASAAPTKVLYFGGYSRSGSTLFDRMLGQIRSFTSTGELAYVWTHGVADNRLCGCGTPFHDCAFWRQVGERAFGGWDKVDVSEMVTLYQRVNRHRYLPFLIFPRLSRRYAGALRAYGDVLARLYAAIAEADGSGVVIDSSIDPAYGFLLRHVPGLDLRVVHFVRDSRGTAFSWMRKVVRNDVVNEQVYMPTFHPGTTALRWTAYHLLLHLLGRMGVPSLRVRYEDVVARPREQVAQVAQFLDEEIEGKVDLGSFRPGEFELAANHTVAGNRMRLHQGAVAVRVDDEWRRAMPERHRRLVTILSWPLLRRYGYVGGRAAGS